MKLNCDSNSIYSLEFRCDYYLQSKMQGAKNCLKGVTVLNVNKSNLTKLEHGIKSSYCSSLQLLEGIQYSVSHS